MSITGWSSWLRTSVALSPLTLALPLMRAHQSAGNNRQMAYDVVIRNGTRGRRLRVRLVPGRRRGSSATAIARVGRIRERGAHEIDAEGHVVTPGFIDGHTHMDAQVFWDPPGANSCWHGVTTVVMGNCGFTLAPVRDDARALVVRNLERAEDIDPAALAAGIDWSWETFPEYLDAVDRLPKAINYAANIGHSALRTWAMGERAFEERGRPTTTSRSCRASSPTRSRRARSGFTTSRSEHHETSDDRPVASRLAAWDEVVRARRRDGRRSAPASSRAASEHVLSPDPEQRELARRPDARPRGRDRRADDLRHHRHRSRRLRDARPHRPRRRRRWAHDRPVALPRHQRAAVVQDAPAVRPAAGVARRACAARRRAAAGAARSVGAGNDSSTAAMEGDYTRWRGIGASPASPTSTGIRVYEHGLPPNPTVAEIAARARACTPVEAMIDLALETDFEQLFIQPSLYPQDEDVLLAVMRHPRTVMTFSDSGAHLSQIADSSIHTHLLGLLGARPPGVHARGGGAHAHARAGDRVGLRRPRPGARGHGGRPQRVRPRSGRPRGARGRRRPARAAGKRLSQRSDGFRATVVGGEVTILDGEPTGATARPARAQPLALPVLRHEDLLHEDHAGDAVVDAPRPPRDAPCRRRSASPVTGCGASLSAGTWYTTA